MMALEVEVHWQRGPTGEPEPLTFRMADTERAVAEVLDRWPGSDRGYIKFRSDDDGLYIFRYEDAGFRWNIVFYRSGEPLPEGLAGKPHLV